MITMDIIELRLPQTPNMNMFFLHLVIVNGTPKSLGATGDPPSPVDPIVPEIHMEHKDPKAKQSLKKIFDQQGPEAFAKVSNFVFSPFINTVFVLLNIISILQQAVRENEGLLVTDTTWRDAHQSLLATRLRKTRI